MEYPLPALYGGHYASYYGSGGRANYYALWARSAGSSGRTDNDFPGVRLRGLPYLCTESDVCDFFSELDIVDILFIKRQGLFLGEALVLFGLAWKVNIAIRKNGHTIRNQHIQVFRCRKTEYYHTIFAQINHEIELTHRRHGHNEVDGVLRMDGLPFSATKKDVIDFFSGFAVSDESVHLVYESDEKTWGHHAYVQFESAEQSKAAMRRDRMMVGRRYVKLFPSTHQEMATAISNSRH